MKRKILALGLLSLCCLGLAASESQAFCGLFNHCNRYCTHITCRPYNAFTPICWGNLVCDGCVPNPCGVAGGCLPLTMGVPPWACPGGGCGMPPGMPSYMGGGGCCASDMGPTMSGPSMPMAPGGGQPPFKGPMPLPVGPNTTMMYPPSAGVAQANYQPMYYPMPYPNTYNYMPTYYPYSAYPQPQPMPYYWYGAGR